MSELSADERMALDAICAIADKAIAPQAARIDRTGELSWDTVHVLADNGFLCPLLPAQYGGPEVSYRLFAAMVEAVAARCASSALLLMAQADGMLPILEGGDDAVRARYLPRLADSPALVAFAATEPGAGSDVLSMKTRAVRDGDHYIVNGTKCFITNGEVADFVTLFAYTDPSERSRGMTALIVDKGTPGLSFGKKEDKMGMRGSVNSTLFFEDARVPVANRVGAEGTGFSIMMSALAGSRLFSAAQAVGIAAGAFEHARAYAAERVQFGKPIAQQPVLRHLFADMATRIRAGRLLVRDAARRRDSVGADDRFGVLAGMAKVFASDTAMSVTTDAVQLLGGYGYSRDYPVERMMRDAKLTQIYTGTNQILRHVIGRAVTAAPEPSD